VSAEQAGGDGETSEKDRDGMFFDDPARPVDGAGGDMPEIFEFEVLDRVDEIGSEFRADGFRIHFGGDLVEGGINALLGAVEVFNDFGGTDVSVVIVRPTEGSAH